MIFQDPFESLNPRHSVEEILLESFIVHKVGSPKERLERVEDLLSKVGLPAGAGKRYPHEFSGGQRQRIGIARAISQNPRLIVCDEPVSALDVSIQSQIINLLLTLQKELGLAYFFISHDLSVVRHIADRVAVMYLGKLMEVLDAEDLPAGAQHPYTRALIAAIPVPDPQKPRNLLKLKGDVPSPINPPSGCRFHTRCPYAKARCKEEEPLLRAISPRHQIACHFSDELKLGAPQTQT